MIRLKPIWREALDLAPVPELVFVTEIPEMEILRGDKTRRPPRILDRRREEDQQKRAFNKALAENLVEDDPLGPDPREGSLNYSQAFSLDEARRNRLAHVFTIIVSKVAEDLSGWPVPGDEEWDIPALMERHITRRPLAHCRRSREREAVVVILDTSGSCLPQARFYNQMADAAIQAGDVELYAAPNAGLRARRTREGWEALDDTSWGFHGRTIIFFGDFDGGDAVVESSWHNKIYWFCSEGDRYPSMAQHPWCSYPMSYFHGRFYDCVDDDDFLRLWRKVR